MAPKMDDEIVSKMSDHGNASDGGNLEDPTTSSANLAVQGQKRKCIESPDLYGNFEEAAPAKKAKVSPPQNPEPSVPVPKLLQMPGEVRNLIYAYTLSAPEGLVLHENGKLFDRTHTLCDHDGFYDTAADEANQLKFVNRQLYKETRGLGLHHNDLVLDGYTIPGGHDFISDGVTVTSTPHELAIEYFASFLQTCSPKHLEHMQKVELNHAGLLTGTSRSHRVLLEDVLVPSLALTANFCAEFTNLQVAWRIPFLYHKMDTPGNFCSNPIALRAAIDELRGSMLFDEWGGAIFRAAALRGNSKFDAVATFYETHLGQNPNRSPFDSVFQLLMNVPCPSNLRFFPLEKAFREDLWRRAGADPLCAINRLADEVGGMDAFITLHKILFEEGL
jgi:hypothetical protein